MSLGRSRLNVPYYRYTAISRIFDMSDMFLGTGICLEVFHLKSDPAFDKSDNFRRESEVKKARETVNALRTAHCQPFDSATEPTDAPAKKYCKDI